MKKTPSENIYYDDGRFKVTDKYLKTPRKTYQISRIEKVSIVRDIFFMGLVPTLALLGFSWQFGAYFYPIEAKIILLIPAIILYTTFRFGTLYITSKALGEPAVIWKYDILVNVREALDKAMHQNGDNELTYDDEPF
ncbi:MAG: hypothetical protein AAF228_05935 [Pseudomonadota bacterium]